MHTLYSMLFVVFYLNQMHKSCSALCSCDGSCLRSFHATKKDGEDSLCDSLNLTKAQVEAEKYYCPNCEYKIHQCFICKKLGSSETVGVFQCVSATCGYFYHPHCVTRRQRLNTAEAEALERQIIAGEYTCPLHQCCVCGNREVKTDSKIAVCCTLALPKVLPQKMPEIQEELLTPVRGHVKFPFTEEKKVVMTEKRKIVESHIGRDKTRSKFKDVASQDTCGKACVKAHSSSFPSSKSGVSTKTHELVSLAYPSRNMIEF